MNKFEIGSRVVEDFDKWNPDEDDTERGEVVGENVKNGHVFVKWDSDWRKPNPSEADPSTLIPEAEADAKLSRLEKEYSDLAKQIHEKVTAAAAMLNEASALASASNLELSEMHDAVRPMMHALRNGGWRTSALHC